jgi:diguanylate cyclase (GGDEF)-like protein/PAS domain S-box-containing protein
MVWFDLKKAITHRTGHRPRTSISRLAERPVRALFLVILIQFVLALVIDLELTTQLTELDNQAANELNLVEVRSLSRSLQRDVLNSIFETDPAERVVIQNKLRTRSAEMRRRIVLATGELRVREPRVAGRFIRLESAVLDRLEQLASVSPHLDPALAYGRFRVEVRPLERDASKLTDEIILRESARSNEMRAAVRRLVIVGMLIILSFVIGVTTLVTAGLRRRLSADVLGPIARVTGALDKLAKGERGVPIPDSELQNEIGDIARAAQVFKTRTALVERLNVFMSVITDAIIVADSARLIIFWNQSAERLLGWTSEAALGQSLDIIVPTCLSHWQAFAQMENEGSIELNGRHFELHALHRNGTEVPVEVTLGTWKGDEGLNIGLVVRDLSERNAAAAEQSRTLEMLDAIIEGMPVSLFVKDSKEGRLQLVNRQAEIMTGLNRDQLIGRTDVDLFPAEQAAQSIARDLAVLRVGGVDISEEFINRADGSLRVLRTRKLAIGGKDGRPQLLLGMSEDITESKETQQRIHHMAHHDSLTGLPNRFCFNERLVSVTEDRTQRGAVMSIDLDRFKAVNDLHGHPVGDRVLCEVAVRLGEVLGDHFVARIGGDEFEALVLNLDDPVRIRQLGERVIEILSQPISVGGNLIHVGASMGIAMLPQDGCDGDTLLRNADLALYRAKSAGRAVCRFFEPEMDRVQREHRALEEDLRNALTNGEIALHFQPLVDLASGHVSGFEALARWTHCRHGPIAPDVFIPIAEASGLIIELGRQVLQAAVEEAATWESPLNIAVNLSPLQMRDGLASEVKELLARTGLAPGRLELEITEGMLILDTDRAITILRELKAMGVRVAMDDFGTGYSSLSYFRLFPFDKVKIDQSFVREMADNPQALAVVQAVIGLGHGLNLSVVAEGVETQSQLDVLRDEGCDQVQGFHIGRPNPINYFDKIVITRKVDVGRAPIAKSE